MESLASPKLREYEVRKLLSFGILVGILMALTVSTLLAAQGQITNVNPSGSGIQRAEVASVDRVDDGLNTAGVLSESTEAGTLP